MKRRALLAGVGSIGALALVASLAITAAGSAGTADTTATAATAESLVASHQAAEGAERESDQGEVRRCKHHLPRRRAGGQVAHPRQDLVAKFSKDTGIKVKLVPHPVASDASYAQLARTFSANSSAFDVVMLDVLWTGAFGPYLYNLKTVLAQGRQAALEGDHPQQHRRREACRDAVVRGLRDPLLPHGSAQEVRVQRTAEDVGPARRDGAEDPGRRAGEQRELLRLRVPGQRVRGADV